MYVFNKKSWSRINLIAATLACTPVAFVGAQALHTLGDKKDEWGKYRLWGAVGWGVAAGVFGRLVQDYGPAVSFYAYGGAIAVCMLVISGFDSNWEQGRKVGYEEEEEEEEVKAVGIALAEVKASREGGRDGGGVYYEDDSGGSQVAKGDGSDSTVGTNDATPATKELL
jgi:hypothetical protein